MAEIDPNLTNPMAGMMPPEETPMEPEIDVEEMGEEEEGKPEKEKNLPKDPEILAKFQDRIRTDKDNREYVDWNWYIYDSYVKGNHFVKYNDATKMIEAIPGQETSRFAINKIYTTLRAVRGFVTKYDPKWYVFPENNSVQAIKSATHKQKVLDNDWYIEGLKPKAKQGVFHGLKYSIGIDELGWDAEERTVTHTILDPFEVFFGGPAFPYCNRVTKTVWRTLDEINSDERYKGKMGAVLPSDEQYASTTKQTLQDDTYGHQNKADADMGTIVYEQFYVVPKENSKGGRVNIATFTDTSFLRHIETDYDSLWDIFKIYRTDDNPGETYGEGWVKNLIPPQKLLDILESLTAEYHHMFAKGRYVVSKNSGTRVINNQHGIILEHNAGKRPVVENAPSMAASVDNQISRINVYLEDIGGQHDASLGRIPTGASAGVAIEALQEGDANNLKDLVENFNIWLVDIAQGVFKMYARKLKTTKIIPTDDKDKDGKPDFFAIIGEEAENKPDFVTFGGKQIPVTVIKEDEKVRVTVDSWLAYTRDAREQRIYKHYTAGLIDRKTALESLQYGDIDGIIEMALKEQVVSQMVAAGPAEPPPPTEAPPEGPPETETAGAISPDAGIPTPNLSTNFNFNQNLP